VCFEEKNRKEIGRAMTKCKHQPGSDNRANWEMSPDLIALKPKEMSKKSLRVVMTYLLFSGCPKKEYLTFGPTF